MRNRYLLPLKVLEKESLSPGLVDFLSNNEVVLLGYHILPEQTPVGQARTQFLDKMEKKLDSITSSLNKNDVEVVDKKIVFTHDEEETVDRISEEKDVDGIIIPNPAMEIKNILVVITHEDEVGDLTNLLESIVGRPDYLFDVAVLGEPKGGEEVFDELNKVFIEKNIDLGDFKEKYCKLDELMEEIGEYDLIVMADVKKKLTDLFKKELPQKIADTSLGPVIITLRREVK